MSMAIDAAKLRSILVDPGLVEAAEFDRLAAETAKSGAALDDLLAEKGLVPDQYLGQLIADAMGFPFANLENKKVADHVLRSIPERVARRTKMIAFGIDEQGRLKLALREPQDLEQVHLVEKKIGVRVVPHFATMRGIRYGLEHYSRDLEAAITKLLQEAKDALEAQKSGAKLDPEDAVEQDGIIVNIVELILDYAYQNNASDIHIEPHENTVIIRYRIDGILHDVATMPRDLMDLLVTRIKVLSKLRTDEHFAAQDGKFQQIIDKERIDVRVSILPIVDGEKIVMRLLTDKGKSFDLKDLGFSKQALKILQPYLKKSFGMILATGPTGSGKTTTMYAVLKLLNTRTVNIATIEDPIEYGLEGVNQIQVNAKTGLTFAAGLRSIVRQDPNIIMVGEIRDAETAGISVNAAMTGHLVLSTLHTNDAATTLPRFRDMQIEPFLIASTVNVIVAQRLVRKICQRCIFSQDRTKEEIAAEYGDAIADAVLARAGSAKKKKPAVKLYKGKGCDTCGHSGYRGRIGIYELLEMNDRIRELIMANANARIIMQEAVKYGMVTMFEDGIDKSLAGVTTVDEIVRATGGVNS
jgi:type IV pilus assembly protein PilB